MKTIHCFLLTVLALSVLTLRAQTSHEAKHQDAPSVTKAVAVLHPTTGKEVRGMVTFEAGENGVRVVAHVTGLTPGKHGFHIHEFGDCSSADGSSAGGHYNPTGMQHNKRSSDKRHVGDLGNIDADDEGVADLDYVDAIISFSGPTSIIGRGVIVHEKEDDFETQPTGAAGARLACGIIGVAKP